MAEVVESSEAAQGEGSPHVEQTRMRRAPHGGDEADEVQVDDVHVPLSDDEAGEDEQRDLEQLAAAFQSAPQ